jgi:predicted subunit of tRNA(5-methylaminomethyl-2-thiouridylate) methyltransferase
MSVTEMQKCHFDIEKRANSRQNRVVYEVELRRVLDECY